MEQSKFNKVMDRISGFVFGMFIFIGIILILYTPLYIYGCIMQLHGNSKWRSIQAFTAIWWKCNIKYLFTYIEYLMRYGRAKAIERMTIFKHLLEIDRNLVIIRYSN